MGARTARQKGQMGEKKSTGKVRTTRKYEHALGMFFKVKRKGNRGKRSKRGGSGTEESGRALGPASTFALGGGRTKIYREKVALASEHQYGKGTSTLE